MGKSVADSVLDGAWNIIKNNCNRMCVCSAQPTTYNEATSTYELADVAMAGSDFTIADGDTNGRKMTVGAKTGVAVDASGTGTHVALVDTVNSALLYVTTCPSQGVSSGGTVDIGSFKGEIADPA